MLRPGRFIIFALFSVIMHASFALLFGNVRLSFSPPLAKDLSITIVALGGGPGEIIQSEAAWVTPERTEPDFSAGKTLENLDSDAGEWTQFAFPGLSAFVTRETLAPRIDVLEFAEQAFIQPSPELFAQLPPESKSLPASDLVLGPAIPEILEDR